ncbi:hypothetical protein [Clostridium butyricum]
MKFIVIIILIGIVLNIYSNYKSTMNIPGNKNNPLTLPNNRPLPIVHGDIILKANETCHYCGDVLLRIVKNKIVGYSGGGSGVSFRITKGVSYRISNNKRVPIRQNISEDYAGVLNITNKRISFIGEKGFNHNLANIVSMVPYSDAIQLQFNNKNYILMTYDANYIYQIIQRILNSSNTSSGPKKLSNGLEYFENKADWYANKNN